MKLYMNMGSNQGVKVGDYFRVVRSYTATLKDPVDSLSFKAQTSEDTQKVPPTLKPIASPGPKGRTSMWPICRGAPWEKWSSST